MKPSEIRAMSDAQVEVQLTELLEEWRNLRFQEAVGSLTDTARIGKDSQGCCPNYDDSSMSECSTPKQLSF